eukprot:m.14607 g.14607  ORF g.14607 m.14607 type:complete len:469 (+) comp6473_c0_seq1:119-1525(+)
MAQALAPVTFDALKEATDRFDMMFVVAPRNSKCVLPLETNNPFAKADVSEEAKRELEKFAEQSWPIVDHSVLDLLQKFIDLKTAHGSELEQRVYREQQITSPKALITRLLKCRPLMFMNSHDQYLLREGFSGSDDWMRIHEQLSQKVPLDKYISYPEMQLAALLGVSTRTHFINNGARGNVGKPAEPGTFQREGVYTGLVGARFEREGVMEYAHMVIDKLCTPAAGYGPNRVDTAGNTLPLWAAFYDSPFKDQRGHYFPSYEQVHSMSDADLEKHGLAKLQYSTVILNVNVYKKRLALVLRPFFADADQRAAAEGKKAYTHLVGLGLGVWQLDSSQQAMFVDTVGSVLRAGAFKHIAVVDFSYFDATACHGAVSGEKFPDSDITIVFSRRNPAEPVDGSQLLVAMYAWDSNSYPGNEYWIGAFAASGDPAAACCSEITFLQNPLINPRISGDNVRAYPLGGAAAAASL